MTTTDPTLSVLMVCLGNICRSPTAQGVLRKRLAASDLDGRIRLASAGTGPWYIGKPPDRRAIEAAAGRGYDITDLRGRQVEAADLDRFDYVIAMDESNRDDLLAMAGDDRRRRGRIHMLSDFSDRYTGEPVPDPYYGAGDGFEHVLDMIETCVDGLIKTLRRRLTD